MSRRSLLSLVILLAPIVGAVGACGSDPASAAPANVAGETACEAGQRPVAGTGACIAVGTTSVPAGFVAKPWGFAPIAPATPCTGATIALLGKDACEPIDDCSAAFPPATATVAVRKGAVAYPGRGDLVVVATLPEALAQADSGAIIAIDSVVAVRTSTIRKNGVALAVRGGRALLSESAVTGHADAIQLDHVTFVQTDESRDAADLQVLAARTTFARNTRLVTEHALTAE